MFFGMMSGVVGQAPLAALIGSIGWRNSMFAAAGFAGILTLLIVTFVRDAPPGHVKSDRHGKPLLPSLKQALQQRDVWLVSLVAMAMTGPLLAYGGLWGVPYMMAAFDLSRPEAAFYVSLMLIGWAASAPVAGWLSDLIGYRKWPLVGAAFAETLLIAALIFVPGLPLLATVAVMILIGLTGAAMAICFALAREVSDPAIHGASSGIVNAMTVASGAVLQPIIGLLLDRQWDGTLLAGARVYTPEQYRAALISLLVCTAIGAIITLFLRETRCRAMPTPSPAAAMTSR